MQNVCISPPCLSYYSQLKKKAMLSLKQKESMLQSENWGSRVNSRMELEPWHLPPISHNMHSKPCFSIRNVYHSQACAQLPQRNWSSSSGLMPEGQGNASSAMTPLPPVSIGTPREESKVLILLVELALVISLRTAVAPIERVKLLMQSQNALIQSGRLSQPYKGIFNCFASTIRNEGVISLWRGNTARVMGQCCPKVIGFATSSYIKSCDGHLDNGGLLALGGLFAAWMFVDYPLTYAGVRLATDVKTTSKVGKWKFGGMVDVYRHTLKSDGIRGIYRGYNVSFFNNVVKFHLYTALKPGQIQFVGFQNNLLATAMVEFVLTSFSSVATYLMDTVSKRMMMTSGDAIKYKDSSDAFSKIFKKEGLKAFYKGAGADLLWGAALFGLITFLDYLVTAPAKPKDDGSRGDDQPSLRLRIRWVNGKRETV